MRTFPSRRDFLATAPLALTATAPLAATTPAPAENDVDARKGVGLAIATICVDGFGDENFAPAFALLPTLGYTHVEFNVWHPRNMTPAGMAGIRERCAAAGLTPVCLQGSAFGAPVVKDVAHKLWLMEQAKALGCRRVKFTGARRDTAGGLDAVIETLHALAPAAEAMDVLVLVENHANNVIETIDDYERIFAAIDSRHVGMCLDTGHFDGAGISNLDVIARFHPRILHVDLKDNAATGTYKVVNYGEGTVDLPAVVQAVLSRGFSGYLLIEQAPPLRPSTLADDLRRARELFGRYVR